MAEGKVVGLDIGTSMIRVAIGEIDPDTGNIRIAGTASRKSAGLRNGVIVNIEDVVDALSAVQNWKQNKGTVHIGCFKNEKHNSIKKWQRKTKTQECKLFWNAPSRRIAVFPA